MALVECLAVRLSSLTLQHQQRIFSRSDWRVVAFSRSSCEVATQQRTPLPKSSPLSRKRHNAALAFEKCKEIRLQEKRTKGFVSRRKDLRIRAISSTGPLVSDLGEGGEDELRNVDETKEEVVQKVIKQKKRIIAGVDQTKLLEPHLLADPDSRFAEYYGVQIHHKIARPSVHSSSSPSSTSVADVDKQRVNLPAILLHGFGASLFSWEIMMPKLAEILEAPALAFDRPGFGFTSRTFPPSSSCPIKESPQQKFKNSYTVAFSAAATLAFIEFLKFDQAIVIGYLPIYPLELCFGNLML